MTLSSHKKALSYIALFLYYVNIKGVSIWFWYRWRNFSSPIWPVKCLLSTSYTLRKIIINSSALFYLFDGISIILNIIVFIASPNADVSALHKLATSDSLLFQDLPTIAYLNSSFNALIILSFGDDFFEFYSTNSSSGIKSSYSLSFLFSSILSLPCSSSNPASFLSSS